MRLKKAVLIGCLIVGFGAHAQTINQDTLSYNEVFKWVERKLTFNYYDPTNKHWWVNMFQENINGSITIKNVAAQHPSKVMDKVYHLRQFFLYDINPNRVSVVETPTDQGRFVKGRILQLEGFSDEKKIATKKDGVAGTDVNFVHVSVPAFLEDSLRNYAFQLQEKLRQLIYLNARLYNLNDDAKNQEAVFSALRGKYVNQDSTAYLTFEVVEAGHVRYEWRVGDQRWYGHIGYDAVKRVFYIFRSSAKGYYLRDFMIDATATDLILKSGQDQLYLIGRNTLEFALEGKRQRFSRY